jgi:LuxR family maltose regulon positive regulatory protein
VRHWLAAGESGHAGEIVCRAHMSYTRCARYETIRRRLDMFTDEQIFADPALTLAAGWIGPMAGDSARGRTWLGAAFRIKVGDGMWPGAPVPLRAMQAGLVAALAPEGVTQMRENAELAVSLSEGAPPTERAAVTAFLGLARWLGGNSAAGLRILRAAEEEGAVGNVLAQNGAAGYMALILADEGRWAEARRLTLAGLLRVEEAGLSWGVPTLPILLARARLQAHDGDPAVAESVATIAALVAPGSAATSMALLGEVVVGELLAASGDLAAATHWMHAGFARLATLQDAGILRPRLLQLRDLIERRQLLQPLTPAERHVLELLPTELSLKEIGSRLHVSHETARTHARDIYRKLEVHSRSEAVARARELGLVAAS